MININTIVVACILSFLAGSISSWNVTKNHYTNKYELEITRIYADHEKRLLEETNLVLEAQQRLDALKEETVETNEQNQKKISQLHSRIDDLIKSGDVRLRDPNKTITNCTSSSSTTISTSSSDDSGGDELPPETARFLWGEASRADSLVSKLTSCQQYVKQITQFVNNQTNK